MEQQQEQPIQQTHNSIIEQVYENEEQKLKHLDFVEATVEKMVEFLTKLYELTKENSGPLKARVEAIEGFLTTIIGPICDKYHHLPFQLLQFLDHKVDELIHEVDWRHEPWPNLVTHVVKKAAEIARELAMELQATGLLDATANAAKEAYLKYKPVAKSLVIKYEPVAEKYAVWAWQLCKQIPVVSEVTQTIMVPTAAFWAERYNQMVDLTADSGLPMAHYLPLIPLGRIAHLFAQEADRSENEVENVSEGGMAVTY